MQQRTPSPMPSSVNQVLDPDTLVLLLRHLQVHQSDTNSIKEPRGNHFAELHHDGVREGQPPTALSRPVPEHSIPSDNAHEIPVQTFERSSDLNRANIAHDLSITDGVASNGVPSVVPPFKTDGPSSMEIDRFVELLRRVQPQDPTRDN